MSNASVVMHGEGPPGGSGGIVKHRYALGARIGWDRAGAIYEALDTTLSEANGPEHRVALQFLPQHVALDRSRLEAFKAEFVRVRALSHPGIARVYDLDADEHGAFMTMELLEGASVAAVCAEASSEPVTSAEAFAIVRAAGDALAHAHAAGVVHGALGLEDVVVTVDYEVKIKGFLRPQAGMKAGHAAGPAPRDDVHALARLAYALLMSERSAGRGAPRDVRARPRGLSGRQWKTLARALSTDRDAWPADVAALLTGLEITGDETLPAAVGTKPRAARRVRRPFWLAAAVALAAAGVYHGQERLAGAAAWLDAELGFGAASEARRAAGAPTAGPSVAPSAARLDIVEVPPLRIAEPAPGAYVGPGNTAAADAPTALPELAVTALPERAVTVPAAADRDADPAAGTPAGASPTRDARADTRESAADGTPTEPEPGTTAPAAEPPTFAFASGRVTVSESAGIARLAVRRAGDASGTASIAWWSEPGTAQADEDYADLGRIEETFAAGQRELAIYVPITSDAVAEPEETFDVRFVETAADTAGAAATRRATVTIVDDD